MYRKKNYPYAQVTPLALLLWNHFFSDIRIILYLIYDKYELKEPRILYEENLKQTNVDSEQAASLQPSESEALKESAISRWLGKLARWDGGGDG